MGVGNGGEVGFAISGKFIDDSEASDWYIHPDGNANKSKSIAEFVNPITKKFKYQSKYAPTTFLNFWYNTKLEYISNISGANDITDWAGFLQSIRTLKYADLSNINIRPRNVIAMFEGNVEMHSVYFGQIDFSAISNFQRIFSNCTSLINVTGDLYNIKSSIDLHWSPLTPESAMVFINGLAEINTNQTLTLKDTTFDSLTEEQIKMATDKGWIVQRG